MMFLSMISWLGLRSDSPTNFPQKRKIGCYGTGSFLEWNLTCQKPSDTYLTKILILMIYLWPLSEMKPRI